MKRETVVYEKRRAGTERPACAFALTLSLAAPRTSAAAAPQEQTQTAAEPAGEQTEEEKEQDPYQKVMEETYRQEVQTNKLKDWPQGPGIYGEAGIVMDAETGAVLYGKNIDKEEYPASITKLLTALLAFRYSEMTDEVVITAESLACLGKRVCDDRHEGGQCHLHGAGSLTRCSWRLPTRCLRGGRCGRQGAGAGLPVVSRRDEPDRGKSLAAHTLTLSTRTASMTTSTTRGARDMALVARELFCLSGVFHDLTDSPVYDPGFTHDRGACLPAEAPDARAGI